MSNDRTTIIKGYSNLTKEGIVLHLNSKSSLKDSKSKLNTKEVWVSWDKIGSMLFDNYESDFNKISDLREQSKDT